MKKETKKLPIKAIIIIASIIIIIVIFSLIYQNNKLSNLNQNNLNKLSSIEISTIYSSLFPEEAKNNCVSCLQNKIDCGEGVSYYLPLKIKLITENFGSFNCYLYTNGQKETGSNSYTKGTNQRDWIPVNWEIQRQSYKVCCQSDNTQDSICSDELVLNNPC